MARLLLLLVLAALPVWAGAHEGHHSPATEPAAHDAPLVTTAVGASRCPGGGHEDCCCHDGWCTTGSATPAVIDAPAREVARVAIAPSVVFATDVALPSAALLRFPPRGPPAVS